jgi:hypothetical protein
MHNLILQHVGQGPNLQTMEKENPILASFINYNAKYKTKGNFSWPQVWCGSAMGEMADTNMRLLVYFQCLMSADHKYGQQSTKTCWD